LLLSFFVFYLINSLLALQSLYELGARKLVVFGLGKIGCVPGAIDTYGTNGSACVELLNNASQIFNSKLLPVIDELNDDLPDAKIIYINNYKIGEDSTVLGRYWGFYSCCISFLLYLFRLLKMWCGRPYQLKICPYVSQISRSIIQRAVHHLPLVNAFRTKFHARIGPNTCSGIHSIQLRFLIFSMQRDLIVLWTLPMLIHMIFAT